jgi:hypothetical protein
MWCIAEITAEYLVRMHDLFELCAKPYDPKNPVYASMKKANGSSGKTNRLSHEIRKIRL